MSVLEYYFLKLAIIKNILIYWDDNVAYIEKLYRFRMQIPGISLMTYLL